MHRPHHPSHSQCNTPGYLGESNPQTISEDSRNTSNYRGHTHKIERATTEQAGIVKLNNTLTSEAVHEALTAAQGKELAERIQGLTQESQNEEINRRLEAALGYLSTRYNAAYPTYARALSRVSVLPNNALVYVVNDPDETKNGLYYVDALSLVKAPFDALSTAFTTDAMRVFQSIMTETPYTELTYNGVGTYSVSTIKAVVEEFKIEKEEKYLEMFDRADIAIEELIRNGMVRGFTTEASLKQWQPAYTGARAKADDTKKIWRWEITSNSPLTGVWIDTGASEKDQAIAYADSNPLFKVVRLNVDTNLDDILTDGHYSATLTEASLTRNYPVEQAGHLEVGLIGQASRYQMYTTLQGKVYLRTRSTTWSEWKVHGMDTAHPKITTTVLAASTNLDDVIGHGTYSFTSANADLTLNFPVKDSGTLIVDRVGNVSVSQIALCLTGRMFLRFKSASWLGWTEIATVPALVDAIRLEASKQNKARTRIPDLTNVVSSSYVVIPINPQGVAEAALLSKNPTQSLPPASLTKIMTTLLAIESGRSLDSAIEILPEDIVIGSGFNFFREGDAVTLRDCLYGMMLPSANIAALAVARTLGGTVDNFVLQMNQRAQSLGMTATVFKNPTGLAATGQVTTASDLAKLAQAALNNQTIRNVWGQAEYSYTVGSEVRNITSSLVAIQSYEPWALGGKTGTLGSICNQLTTIRLPNGYTGIVIQMNAPNSATRAADTEALALKAINGFNYPSVASITEKLY